MPRLGTVVLLLLVLLALASAAHAADTKGPNITVISPTENQLYGTNSTIRAAVDAWDDDGAVRHVDFKLWILDSVRDETAPFPTRGTPRASSASTSRRATTWTRSSAR